MQKSAVMVVKHQAEHGGHKLSKYNVEEPISSYGTEWCSFSQNSYIDDIVFLNHTLYVRLRPNRQKVGKGPNPSFRNMLVKLLALRLSAIDVRPEFNSSHYVTRHNLRQAYLTNPTLPNLA